MIKKAYIDTKKGQIHFRYAGPESKIPILFFHQNTSSSAMFQDVMNKLGRRYRVIAMDLPGFGASYNPPKRFDDITYLTEVLMEAIDNLGITDYHVCGQHTGASIAVEMGALYPERIKTVITIGPIYLTEKKRQRYRQVFNGSVPPDLNGDYLRQMWATLCQGGANANIRLLHREMWEALRSWKARGWVYQCVWDHDFNGYFDRLKCPVLIMAAKDDVLFAGFEYAKNVHPEVDACIVKGSNFEPELDPDGVASGIEKFLLKYGWQ